MSLRVTPIIPKLNGTSLAGRGAHGASSENLIIAESPTATILISANPKLGVTNSTKMLVLSGDLTTPVTPFNVIPKNLEPVSNSSIISNFALAKAANFALPLDNKSSTDSSGSGRGVGVGSSPHAATKNTKVVSKTVMGDQRRTREVTINCLPPSPRRCKTLPTTLRHVNRPSRQGCGPWHRCRLPPSVVGKPGLEPGCLCGTWS